MDENRDVTPRRKSDLDPMTSALALVKLRQTFPQSVGFDPGDGVFRSIEYRLGAAEDLGRDVVFIELVDFAAKELLSHIAEQLRQSRPSGERSYNALQFGPLCFYKWGAGILWHC